MERFFSPHLYPFSPFDLDEGDEPFSSFFGIFFLVSFIPEEKKISS